MVSNTLSSMVHEKNRFQALLGVANLISFFFENAWEVIKSKCENQIKCVSKICKMMRGFQIWPQISNRIKFGLFLAKKTVGNWQHTQFSPFWVFFAKKGVQYYPIWILRSDLESSHHFAYFRHIFDMIFVFWFFDLQCIFKNLILNSRPLKVLEIAFFMHHWNQRV